MTDVVLYCGSYSRFALKLVGSDVIIGAITKMPQQPELWIGVVELKPFNQEEYGAAGAFTNIVTWACTAAEFRKKADTIAETLNLYVISIEREEPIAERTKKITVSDEIEDMIERAESNPNAIVYGTFHTYPFNEA